MVLLVLALIGVVACAWQHGYWHGRVREYEQWAGEDEQ